MRSTKTLRTVGVLVMSLGLPAAAFAGGDAAAGKTKATACMACHVSASPTDDTPHLAGQRATYIAKQLKAYKAGDRKQPVMNAMAGALSEGDIDNLAAFWAAEAAGSDTTLPADLAAVKKGHMAFPKDFPKGFIQYRTTTKGDGTIAKQWINKTGMDAVKAGKDKLSDGSVLIVENYVPKLDADKKPVTEKDGTPAVDKLKNYEGMEVRAGWDKGYPELLVNRDWNYAVFMPDKSVREVNQAICLSCHIPAASTDYVFTLDKIKAKAK